MDGGGYVLAGGSSRRFGRDKAFVELGGLSLVERAINKLRELGLEVQVVCRSNQQARLIACSCVLDRTPGLGPAMAIYSALRDSDHNNNYFLACDMPLVPSALLQGFPDLSKGFDVVVPADAEARVQPLCGYYSRACLPVLEGQLNKGVMSITQILKSGDLKVHIVDAGKADMDQSAFLNVNDRKSLHQVSVQLENHSTLGRS